MLMLVALGDLAFRIVPLPLLSSVRLRRAFSVIYATGVGLLFFVYRTFPNTAVPVRAAATATLTVTLLWETARWIFTAYVRLLGVHSTLYGSFGIGVAGLVWLYYSATIFVFGAELAAVVAQRRDNLHPTIEGGTTTSFETCPGPGRGRGRGRLMAFKYAFIAILASAITVFALQNNAPTSIRFLVWNLEGTPLATVVLASMGVGMALVGTPLFIAWLRLRSRARSLEARAAQLEPSSAEREHSPKLPPCGK